MNELRIVFMGTPQFAIPSLDGIYQSGHKLVGIVTQPDRPKGRGKRLAAPPVKQFALENNITPLLQPDSLKDSQFINSLRDLKADVFVVVAFRILPEEVFSMAAKGTVNVHPSLLPKYRGAAPINWAIIQGEKITGVTTIFIKKEIDAGNIIMQKEVPIKPNETAGSLHDRLADIGADLLMESLDRIAKDTVEVMKQDEKLVTKAPKLTKEICHLNFNQTAESVKNWIHGLSPYPGAYALLNGNLIKIFRADVISEDDRSTLMEKLSQRPGAIVNITRQDLWVACGPGIIKILELQMEGHRRLNTEEFLRGHRPEVGDVFC